MDVIKYVGKYLDTPVGQVCYSTDKVLTTSLDKENVEGFASIVLRLTCRSGTTMSQEETLQSYQWLEHIAMYSNQATANFNCAKIFLQGINKALEKTTYLTGNHLNVTDVAAYHVLYPLIERLSIYEQESLLHLCRWSKHIQAQPKVCEKRPPLSLNALSLSLLAPLCAKSVPLWVKDPLPKQIYPHELNNVSLDKPVVYFPQPFSFPGYPIILYL